MDREALKKKSGYSASFTARALGFYEMESILPVLMDETIEDKVTVLTRDTAYLKIASLQSRKRVLNELLSRYNSVDPSFWRDYAGMSEGEKRLALFYVVLKTYTLLFEIQVNLVVPKYNSPDRVLTKNDIYTAVSDIASRDSYVDSWSDDTRNKVASQYLTILRQAGLIDETSGEIREPSLPDESLAFYSRINEAWFLAACCIPKYRLDRIRQMEL